MPVVWRTPAGRIHHLPAGRQLLLTSRGRIVVVIVIIVATLLATTTNTTTTSILCLISRGSNI
jgi:hypothetical protein